MKTLYVYDMGRIFFNETSLMLCPIVYPNHRAAGGSGKVLNLSSMICSIILLFE